MRQRRAAAEPLDAKSVDALYGLEPVYEPGAARGLREFAEVQCPSCGEVFGTMIDLTSGEQAYIEDCQVCCQPMLLAIEVGERGELVAVTVQRA